MNKEKNTMKTNIKEKQQKNTCQAIIISNRNQKLKLNQKQEII